PILENPFRAMDETVAKMRGETANIIVDVHGETTSEKIAMGRFLDGKVSAVIGTHTHVQTADEQILPGGTAFLCDAGMTGPYEGVLGLRLGRVLGTTVSFIPSSFDVATGDPRLAGAIVDVDATTGQAHAIRRVM